MYGAPVSSVPTSSTRATCSLLSRTAARASRRKRSTDLGRARAPRGSRNLIATRCSSCEVRRRDDDAHAARAEHALDPVLAREHLADHHAILPRHELATGRLIATRLRSGIDRCAADITSSPLAAGRHGRGRATCEDGTRHRVLLNRARPYLIALLFISTATNYLSGVSAGVRHNLITPAKCPHHSRSRLLFDRSAHSHSRTTPDDIFTMSQYIYCDQARARPAAKSGIGVESASQIRDLPEGRAGRRVRALREALTSPG